DAVATAAIAPGLSPFRLLSVGTLIVVAYLILSIKRAPRRPLVPQPARARRARAGSLAPLAVT
ncbi:MAG: hypothetical protein KJ006_12395, partial [Thermoleophilia bacterium]|nr:hypothetical protein [Thermoleophilia bacterium]